MHPRRWFFTVHAAECAVSSGSQGRTIFNHVKIVLDKIARTLPVNFNALLTTSPHHIPAERKILLVGLVIKCRHKF